jgi:hypothetical protein
MEITLEMPENGSYFRADRNVPMHQIKPGEFDVQI